METRKKYRHAWPKNTRLRSRIPVPCLSKLAFNKVSVISLLGIGQVSVIYISWRSKCVYKLCQHVFLSVWIFFREECSVRWRVWTLKAACSRLTSCSSHYVSPCTFNVNRGGHLPAGNYVLKWLYEWSHDFPFAKPLRSYTSRLSPAFRFLLTQNYEILGSAKLFQK